VHLARGALAQHRLRRLHFGRVQGLEVGLTLPSHLQCERGFVVAAQRGELCDQREEIERARVLAAAQQLEPPTW
jgi:hypothetical protein